jgi:hypothetical protein
MQNGFKTEFLGEMGEILRHSRASDRVFQASRVADVSSLAAAKPLATEGRMPFWR